MSDWGMSMLATLSPNSYGLVCWQLDGAFADDRPLMAAAAGCLQVRKDLLQQAALKQAIGFGREFVAALAARSRPCCSAMWRR